jgi:predicted ribosome quality control (RQC) complex YloA/Tae2 family protein
MVFHAEITGSPFVVIKSEGKPVSEQALREAGELRFFHAHGGKTLEPQMFTG